MIANIETLEHQIENLLAAGKTEELRALVKSIFPADLAEILERLKPDEQLTAFKALPLECAVDTLHEMGTHAIQQIFGQLTPAEIAPYLNAMAMDDVAHMLTRDLPTRQQELLTAMNQPDAQEVRDLMQYPAQSAGRLMTEKFARIRPDMTADEAIAYVRQIGREVETVTDLYVVNPQQQLIGVISLREVVTAQPSQKIQDIMIPDVVSVAPEADREEVARLVSRYDFLAVPVVKDQHMLGVITVDDIIHVLVEEGTEDALKFGGVEGGVMNEPYFTIPIYKVIRTRIGWLLLLFVAETLTGSVLRLFEAQLQAVVALSFFIPLLIGTGGNTGAQTVSTIIRGLALKEIRLQDTLKVVRRELGSGLLIGLLLGTVAFFRTILWGGLDLSFCLVIGLTIFAICTWANTIGAIIPLLAQHFKIDPAVVSAPLITTLVDATGLAIYLSIAKIILHI